MAGQSVIKAVCYFANTGVQTNAGIGQASKLMVAVRVRAAHTKTMSSSMSFRVRGTTDWKIQNCFRH